MAAAEFRSKSISYGFRMTTHTITCSSSLPFPGPPRAQRCPAASAFGPLIAPTTTTPHTPHPHFAAYRAPLAQRLLGHPPSRPRSALLRDAIRSGPFPISGARLAHRARAASVTAVLPMGYDDHFGGGRCVSSWGR